MVQAGDRPGRGGDKIDVRLGRQDRERFDRVRAHLSPLRPELVEKSEVIRYCLELADEVVAARERDAGKHG